MDPIRLGLSLRALRRRHGWTLDVLAGRAGLSRSALSRVERGGGDALSLRAIDRLVSALGARTSVRILWHGEELDRLLDSGHAELVERTVSILAAAGWESRPEVSFNRFGERGSIDVLARHPATRSILVVEVKSVVPDIQALLAGLDRKARLAPVVAEGLGWAAVSVSRLLVLPEDRTARRRVDTFRQTFDRVLPARTVDARRWLRSPVGAFAGIAFLPDSNQAGARHRVGRPRASRERGGPVGS